MSWELINHKGNDGPKLVALIDYILMFSYESLLLLLLLLLIVKIIKSRGLFILMTALKYWECRGWTTGEAGRQASEPVQLQSRMPVKNALMFTPSP